MKEQSNEVASFSCKPENCSIISPGLLMNASRDKAPVLLNKAPVLLNKAITLV